MRKYKFSSDWRYLKKASYSHNYSDSHRYFFRNHHKYFCQLRIKSVHNAFDTIEILSLIKNFTSNNRFVKVALDLSFKLSNFVPCLIPKAKWMVAAPIFSAYILAGPNASPLGFSGLSQYENVLFFIWCYVILLPTEIYLSLPCLKEIYIHWFNIMRAIFNIIFSLCMKNIEASLCFEFREVTLFPISSSGKVGNCRCFVSFCVFWIIFI